MVSTCMLVRERPCCLSVNSGKTDPPHRPLYPAANSLCFFDSYKKSFTNDTYNTKQIIRCSLQLGLLYKDQPGETLARAKA